MNIILKFFKKNWTRRIVCHNDPVLYSRFLGVKIGNQCRILDNPASVFGSEPYLVSVGDHVTITSGVRFITHDGGVWIFRRDYPDIDVFGPIQIGNNVFIGFNSLIMPGVSIGDNCIVGAGSVVTKSIPSNMVCAGCPARHIRTTGEYWKRIEPKAFYIRSLPAAKKKELLLLKYAGSDGIKSKECSVRPADV